MEAARFSPAIGEWQQVLGPAHVLVDPDTLAGYSRNAGEVRRSIPAVILPSSTEEVRRVVEIANRYRTPLYPVSGGKNWGLGSRAPVRDGTAVVDLRRMNRIRELNVAHHYAVVEPGVTQRQLYDELVTRNAPLVLNVTGAAADTSLIGNALERGVGYFASRANALSGLEVVLGNGRVMRTGFGHYPDSMTTHLCAHGIGPSLDGLFAESNLGIVTSAGFDLIPKQEDQMVMVARIDRAEELPVFIDALAGLRRRGIVNSVVHVGNRHRTEIVLAPLVARQLYPGEDWGDPGLRTRVAQLIAAEGFGPWSAVGGMMGTPAALANARGEIRGALRGLAHVVFLTDARIAFARRLGRMLNFIPFVRRKEALLMAVEPLYGLARGIPSSEPMLSAFWPVGETRTSESANPDEGHSGMLFCVPVLPAEGPIAEEAVALTERVYAKHGFTPYITLNLVDDRSIETVINLSFDRRDAARVKSAHACNDELTAGFIHRGLLPYRVGIQSMGLVVDPEDAFWATVRDIRKALDPNGIIAPGRYSID